jgi:hypothetical protein
LGVSIGAGAGPKHPLSSAAVPRPTVATSAERSKGVRDKGASIRV